MLVGEYMYLEEIAKEGGLPKLEPENHINKGNEVHLKKTKKKNNVYT